MKKYKDIFYGTSVQLFDFYPKCFICRKSFKRYENHLVTLDIRMHTITAHPLHTDITHPFIRVCQGCIKTPKEAEKVIIPLLKILHGCKIEVDRHYNNKDGYKRFTY